MDYINAFNSVLAPAAIVDAIRQHPNLRPLIPLSISNMPTTQIFWDGFVIRSTR
jgi:hypothetical protein